MVSSHHLPRLVLAAPSSGSGKTMLSTGLMAAWRRRGLVVSPHKVGPDYIDPGYHAMACGRSGRNLDVHLVGESLIVPLLLHGALTPAPADVAVIEGVMGLFDGAIGSQGRGSTAQVAQLTGSPVVLVVNCASSSRSVGAVVMGFSRFDPEVRLAGVILNNVGSARHEAEARAGVANTGVPVVGAVPRLPQVQVPSRHLGLVTAAEHDGAHDVVERLADVAETHLDLDALHAVAMGAPPLEASPWRPAVQPVVGKPVVAVAGGPAFTFTYPETVETLEAAGVCVQVVDPLRDSALPDPCHGLLLGGGFPEVHTQQLADNHTLMGEIRRFVGSGGPTVAECAGLLYLCTTLDGVPLCGAVPGSARMTTRLTLGYRTAVSPADTLVARAGERVTGHEFHRTVVDGLGENPAWQWHSPYGEVVADGYASTSLHASYLHTHWAGHPQMAARFVAAVEARAERAHG